MIYAVEDDAQIREMTLYALKQSGLTAEGFGDAQAFWDAVSKKKPTLVLLDIMLPGEDGMSILYRLRGRSDTRDIPVIMLTAKGAEMERVAGLNAGADDYITKPFSVLELIARVNALLRRTGEAKQHETISLGGIMIDDEKHTVVVQGVPLEMTLKEYELLRHLLRHPEVACTRERLLEAVWDTEYAGNTRTVDVHIQTLRQKLGTAGNQIETVRGVGYRFRVKNDEEKTL